MMETERKWALITGGTKGIGYAVASALAKAGYGLMLAYSSDESAALAASRELSQTFHTDVRILRADISSQSSIGKIQAALEKEDIRLSAVVFNAGLTCRGPLESMELPDWEKVFFANVHFPVFLLQQIIGRINEGGSIVFTGSAMGIHPHAVSLAYGVTKSAVHALVKNLVKTLAPYRIRVNAIAPGFVDTDWQKEKPAAIRQSIESKIALGRFCKPEEVAGIYLTAIENPYLNGEIIVVDGGYSYK